MLLFLLLYVFVCFDHPLNNKVKKVSAIIICMEDNKCNVTNKLDIIQLLFINKLLI